MTRVWIVAAVGVWGLASGCARNPLQTGPESQRAALSLYMRGLMLERSSHLGDALGIYREALEHDYRSAALHVRLGATHVKLGQPEQAFKNFQEALRLDPANRDALRWIAMLETSQGRIEEAIEAYERLLAQDPADRFVLSTLADLHVLQGNLERAVALYEQLIREYGPSYQLHFNLGVLYGRLERFSDAIQELSRALELSPNSIEIRLALGLTYELHRQPDRAAPHYEEAINLDPLNPRLYLHAARVYAEQERTKEAIEHYQTVLDLAPNDLEAVLGLVRLWTATKQFGPAQRLLAERIDRAAQPTDLYLLLGLLYREAGHPSEALRAFERSAAFKDTSAQAHFQLGAQLEQLGQRREARLELRRTIALEPNHADALNYLGYLDAEDGVNLQEAKRLIERALALDPQNGAYLDSLGWVHFQLGEWEKAVEYLEYAARLLGHDPTIFDHLGEAYLKLGRVDQAEAAWHRALELDPELEDIKRKLESLMSREATVPE